MRKGDEVSLLNTSDPSWFFVMDGAGEEGFVPARYLEGHVRRLEEDESATRLLVVEDFKALSGVDMSVQQGDWLLADYPEVFLLLLPRGVLGQRLDLRVAGSAPGLRAGVGGGRGHGALRVSAPPPPAASSSIRDVVSNSPSSSRLFVRPRVPAFPTIKLIGLQPTSF